MYEQNYNDGGSWDKYDEAYGSGKGNGKGGWDGYYDDGYYQGKDGNYYRRSGGGYGKGGYGGKGDYGGYGKGGYGGSSWETYDHNDDWYGGKGGNGKGGYAGDRNANEGYDVKKQPSGASSDSSGNGYKPPPPAPPPQFNRNEESMSPLQSAPQRGNEDVQYAKGDSPDPFAENQSPTKSPQRRQENLMSFGDDSVKDEDIYASGTESKPRKSRPDSSI